MEVGRDSARGRLILLYGPPGTGKTTVLRTLARQWRDWCQFDCILDPETLFANPAYLMEVALDQAGDCSCPDRRHQKWRLLLLEDCDELIRGEAKQHTGQSLSRLLNLTDGLLGQGRKVLVAISTNEDLARLHPAVVRPGRCLARIEVPALPFGEAETWLGTSAGIPADGATLAELYALRDGYGTTAERAPVLSGQYL
jgi:ATP-dependent Zn protease